MDPHLSLLYLITEGTRREFRVEARKNVSNPSAKTEYNEMKIAKVPHLSGTEKNVHRESFFFYLLRFFVVPFELVFPPQMT